MIYKCYENSKILSLDIKYKMIVYIYRRKKNFSIYRNAVNKAKIIMSIVLIYPRGIYD